MKISLFLCVLLFMTTSHAWDIRRLKTHCTKPTEIENIINAEEFYFGEVATIADFDDRFHRLYEMGQRMQDRFYYDESTGKLMAPLYKGEAEVPERFIKSLVAHMQYALKQKLADYIFFPDMGHNHYFIPQEKWDQEYDPIDVADKATLYTKLMNDPDLKMLYHTAEKLTSLDENRELIKDRDVQWRYYTRNVIGENNGQGQLDVLRKADLNDGYNTVREYPGHQYYSGGVYIHSTKNGCFSYEHMGSVYYFDLSQTYFPPGTSYSDTP